MAEDLLGGYEGEPYWIGFRRRSRVVGSTIGFAIFVFLLVSFYAGAKRTGSLSSAHEAISELYPRPGSPAPQSESNAVARRWLTQRASKVGKAEQVVDRQVSSDFFGRSWQATLTVRRRGKLHKEFLAGTYHVVTSIKGEHDQEGP